MQGLQRCREPRFDRVYKVPSLSEFGFNRVRRQSKNDNFENGQRPHTTIYICMSSNRTTHASILEPLTCLLGQKPHSGRSSAENSSTGSSGTTHTLGSFDNGRLIRSAMANRIKHLVINSAKSGTTQPSEPNITDSAPPSEPNTTQNLRESPCLRLTEGNRDPGQRDLDAYSNATAAQGDCSSGSSSNGDDSTDDSSDDGDSEDDQDVQQTSDDAARNEDASTAGDGSGSKEPP